MHFTAIVVMGCKHHEVSFTSTINNKDQKLQLYMYTVQEK